MQRWWRPKGIGKKKNNSEGRWEGTDEIKCEEEEERDGGMQGYFWRR